MSDLNVVEIHERLLGARYLPQEEGEENPKPTEYHWHLTSEHVSELWTNTLSEHWAERVNAEHYQELWGEVLRDLNGREGPVEIIVECRYEFGLTNNDDVSKYLEEATGRGPQFLVVFTGANEEMPMSCVLFKKWEITEVT